MTLHIHSFVYSLRINDYHLVQMTFYRRCSATADRASGAAADLNFLEASGWIFVDWCGTIAA